MSCIYFYWRTLYFHMASCSWLVSFPFNVKDSFYHFFYCMSNFYFSWKVFISPLFFFFSFIFEGQLCQIWYFGSAFFVVVVAALWIYCFTDLWPARFLLINPLKILERCPLLCGKLLFPCCFQDSLFGFDFWQFDYVSWCESLWVYPVWSLLNLLNSFIFFFLIDFF